MSLQPFLRYLAAFLHSSSSPSPTASRSHSFREYLRCSSLSTVVPSLFMAPAQCCAADSHACAALSPLTVRECGPLQALTTGEEAYGLLRLRLASAAAVSGRAERTHWHMVACGDVCCSHCPTVRSFRNSEWFTHVWIMDVSGGTGHAKGSRTVASCRVYGPAGFSEADA